MSLANPGALPVLCEKLDEDIIAARLAEPGFLNRSCPGSQDYGKANHIPDETATEIRNLARATSSA